MSVSQWSERENRYHTVKESSKSHFWFEVRLWGRVLDSVTSLLLRGLDPQRSLSAEANKQQDATFYSPFEDLKAALWQTCLFLFD